MPKNLNDAFNTAKKSRNVMSKHIIWESGVSKTQFYRIIQGKESPSLETKARIAKALEIDDETFDQLHERSRSEQDAPKDTEKPLPSSQIAISPPERNWPLRLVIGAVFIACLAILVATRLRASPKSPAQMTVVNPDDQTEFIEDVTIPDGTSIPVNTKFVKTWRVKNTGSVVWKDRYLKRITPPSELLCSSPAMVPIPETAPGEIVDISVTFVTPHLPGSCRTDWKTADIRGNLYFPDMHGLFSIVTVTK